MKSKQKIILVAICVILLITITFGGCQIINTNDMKHVLNAYTSADSNCRYYTFKARIKEIINVDYPNYPNERYFSFEVDYEYFEEKYSEDDFATLDGVKRWESSYLKFNKYEFKIIPSNYRQISENGGYDLLVDGKEVIISANNYFGWNGWRYPILGLSIDGITYLDFEAGKENYLNYVHAGFKDT